MARREWSAIFVAILIAVQAPQPSRAAMMGEGSSLEWRMASAEIVVRGRVVNIRQLPQTPKLVRELWRWNEVSVAVDEVLKGSAGPSIVFWQPQHADTYALNKLDWDTRGEGVFALETGKSFERVLRPYLSQYAEAPYVLALNSYWCSDTAHHAPPMFLNASDLAQVANAQFRVFTSAAEFLDRCRELCRLLPSAVKGGCEEYVAIPYTAAIDRAGWPPHVMVPVNEEVQKLARGWADSPSDRMRWNAARVLRQFATVENRAALGRIVMWPCATSEADVARELALGTLQEWGVPLTQSQDRLGYAYTSGLLLCVFTLIIVLALVYAWALYRGPLKELRRGRVMLGLRVIVTSILVALWMRSYGGRDGLAGGHWEIGFWDGGICMVHRARRDVTYESPWRLCGAGDLHTVAEHYTNPWYGRRGLLLAVIPTFVDGMSSWHNDISPRWFYTGVCCPLWAVGTLLWVVPAYWVIRHSSKVFWARRNVRGFEVVVAHSGKAALLDRGDVGGGGG